MIGGWNLWGESTHLGDLHSSFPPATPQADLVASGPPHGILARSGVPQGWAGGLQEGRPSYGPWGQASERHAPPPPPPPFHQAQHHQNQPARYHQLPPPPPPPTSYQQAGHQGQGPSWEREGISKLQQQRNYINSTQNPHHAQPHQHNREKQSKSLPTSPVRSSGQHPEASVEMSSSGSLPASPNRANPNSSRLRNWLNAPQTESNPDLLANDTQQREQDQLEMSLSSLGVSDVQSIKQQHSQDEQFDQTRGANQHQDSNETVTLMSRLSSWAGVQMHQEGNGQPSSPWQMHHKETYSTPRGGGRGNRRSGRGSRDMPSGRSRGARGGRGRNAFPAPSATMVGEEGDAARERKQIHQESMEEVGKRGGRTSRGSRGGGRGDVTAASSRVLVAGSMANQGRGSRGVGSGGRGGQELRNLWQQVCQVGKGQKLDCVESNHGPELTVERMLRMVCSLPPGKSVVEVLASAIGAMDSRATAALLKEVAKAGHPGRAVEIFDWLRSQKEGSSLNSLCDVFTYTTMISLCTNRQHLRRAMELIAEMHTRGIPCNVHTYSALMNVCIKCNELELALDVYQEMQNEGCMPSLVTYNILIDMYGKAGRYEDAINVLGTMESNNIDPEVRTYNSIISACSAAGQPAAGLEVYHRLVSNGKSPTATTFTALISAYGKAGQLDRALEMFQEMVVHGCQRNVITFSSLISACEKAGCWELALDMLSDMHKEGCAPNVVTYNSLITACAQGCQWEKASEMFQQMQAEGCRPDSVTYSALISAYEKGGQWRKALEVYEQLQRENCLSAPERGAGSHPVGRNAIHNTAVHNTIVDVLWQTGVVCAQAKALQLYRKAFRNGHFRLTKQIQGDAEVHEVSVPPFSVGAAAISVHRWLSELTEQLSSGAGFSKPRIGFTVWRGKHGREARHSTVKSAVLAMLAGIQSQGDTSGSPSHSTASSPMSSPAACKGVSGILPASATSAAPPVRIIVAQTPFTVIQDSPQCLKLEARADDLAKWLQDPSFASRRNAFVTDNVSALAGSAVVSIGSHRRHASNGSMVVDSKGGAGQRLLQPGPSEDSMSEAAFKYEREVEIRCEKAFEAIRHCESALLLPSPHSEWLSRRMEALVLVGTAANDMGFEEEALHDSLLIADRAAAAGIPVPHSQAALVLLGASLQVVASQVPIMAISPPPGLYPMSPPMTAASALVAHLERAGGLAAGSTADMSRRIAAALSGDLRAISALRCLKLYLERLGYEGQAATKTGHTALSLLRNSLGLPGLLAFMPSQVAAAALYWDRTCSGTIPLWPTALANLTGYTDPSDPTFAAATAVIAAVDSRHKNAGASSPISPLQL